MKRALVTGGTYDDVAPIAVFIMNIAKTNSHLFDEIVVYHNGIKKRDQELIQKIYKTRFIEYKYNPANRNDEVISYFSSMVFCKYECFALLEDYDEVVWSDYDVVVLGKLDNICNANGTRMNILTCEDSLKSMFYKDVDFKTLEKYELDGDGVPTPIFTISKDIGDYKQIHKWCYDKTDAWCDYFYMPEQCVFSLAVQEFNIALDRFPFEIYACYPTNAVGSELIIHAAGQPKFWNGLKNDTWDGMYAEWLKMGGSRYNEFFKKLKRKYLFVKTRLMGIRYREHA